ncbi:hypothetical protein OG784_27350 [Streptomyces sp. NBC_01617]|uniref:hypothetical protein n=1 Tax=Streptomyces sp. NBC_01617 TaxID=2975899 RepID=UPI00386F7DB5|nr:hypothetical protein OG784_27350 [Streptomyces sp. NBC_01617]
MLAQLTVLGSEILPGDVLALKPNRPVEEIGSVQGLSISLHLEDAGVYIVWAARRYLVTREIPDETPASTVLVVGPIHNGDARDFLRGHAVDVAEQTGAVATFALHTNYSVTAYDAVYVLGHAAELRDCATLVLVAEALAAGMPVHDASSPQEAGYCVCGLAQTVRVLRDRHGVIQCHECLGLTMGCAHCGEYGDAEELTLVEDGATFHPVHITCLEEAQRAQPGAVFVTA